jgi:hypothetical protein
LPVKVAATVCVMAELRDWEVELVVLGMAEEQWEEEGERVEVGEREEEGDTENKGVLEFAGGAGIRHQ